MLYVCLTCGVLEGVQGSKGITHTYQSGVVASQSRPHKSASNSSSSNTARAPLGMAYGDIESLDVRGIVPPSVANQTVLQAEAVLVHVHVRVLGAPTITLNNPSVILPTDNSRHPLILPQLMGFCLHIAGVALHVLADPGRPHAETPASTGAGNSGIT